MEDRKAFEAIVYVLRTGIQWNALPRELGASSTVHDRFQAWERANFFKALWQAGLSEYDELAGIEWEWQAVDGVMTKAPFGHAATGANPTDRGKKGTKRSLLTDRAGIPLALVVDGANRHDVRWLSATLDGLVVSRPEPTEEQPQHLCLDAAYDSTTIYKDLLARHYQTHVRSRGEEKCEKEFISGSRARRWVVERTHSWFNRSRRLLVRWEKKGEITWPFFTWPVLNLSLLE
ncbi:MAG: IS5 family transposase [Ktedonobacteraceae bacterium]